MLFKQTFIGGLFCFFLSGAAMAAPSSLVAANNELSVNGLVENQNLNYSEYNGFYPLYNLHGQAYGFSFDFAKTFARWYTVLDLSVTNGNLTYNDVGLGLAKATSFVRLLSGRLGYSFYPTATLGLTPYLTVGYQHWQLDTGGSALGGVRVNGITEVFQTLYYGAGLLGQWAPTSHWVVGADLLIMNNGHSWSYATVPYAGDFFYQQATLGSKLAWQAALKSDYKLSTKLHGLLGIKYTHSALGSGKTNRFNLTVPSQLTRSWQYSAGLGYELDSTEPEGDDDQSRKESLIKANNQANLWLGLLFQDYGELERGRPGYLDRETGQLPQWGLGLSKTWHHLYGQLVLKEAAGYTQYDGSDVFTGAPLRSTTPTNLTDVYGRLGYQWFVLPQASLTPYGVLGYHRWFRSIGYPETYHNNWVGLGGLLQWSPVSRLVLSLDANVGNTFNAQLHTWNTFDPPNTILFESNLGSRSYLMASIGADWQLVKAWHLLGQVNYWRFNYGEGPPVNAAGAHEPTSNTRLLGFTLGLGYDL
jgi:hypothetical protein